MTGDGAPARGKPAFVPPGRAVRSAIATQPRTRGIFSSAELLSEPTERGSSIAENRLNAGSNVIVAGLMAIFRAGPG